MCCCSIVCQGLVPSSRSSAAASSPIVSVVVTVSSSGYPRSRSQRPHRLAAGLLHRGEHPRGCSALGQALAELVQERCRLPPLLAEEKLARAPAREDVDRAPVDEEDLAGDPVCVV